MLDSGGGRGGSGGGGSNHDRGGGSSNGRGSGGGGGGGDRGRASCLEAAGAVLVFLPGTQDIRDVQELLESPPFSNTLHGRALVLPLHGSLSTEEQKRVFDRPPKGLRKVVLATNVAESSVTIDDVVYVVR
jgi:HrpA-like RNA helicase